MGFFGFAPPLEIFITEGSILVKNVSFIAFDKVTYFEWAT